MTAKLLPVFLKCFEDEYISVRSEVCITCGNLEIKDEQVINKLIHLATYDPIWKVKALAIQGTFFEKKNNHKISKQKTKNQENGSSKEPGMNNFDLLIL